MAGETMANRARRDRLLLLAPIMPSDRGNGLAMRAGFFLDAYSSRFDVDLVVAPVAGSLDPSRFVKSRVQRLAILDVAHPDSHYALVASVRDPQARLDAFRRYGRPSLAARIGPACRPLEALIDGTAYAAVHVFRLYLAELATLWLGKERDRIRIVLDCDENDALTYRRIAAMERRRQNLIAADWAEAEAEAFAGLAAAWLPKFDLVFAASRQDARSLAGFAVRTHVVPNTLPAPAARPLARRQRPPTILFVGTLGYTPNADAVTWFVSRVWRRLERALGQRVRLAVVGRNAPAAIVRLRSQRGITVNGSVADISRCYRDADLAIVPLRAGGGTRIKVIEAASHGVPLVTTAFGAQGTTFQRGVDVLMANDEANFLRACLMLLRNGSLSRRLAARARVKAKRDYTPAYWRARVTRLVSGAIDACKSMRE
jgi:glycosyltransferase involved in cell wall biosynthesis